MKVVEGFNELVIWHGIRLLFSKLEYLIGRVGALLLFRLHPHQHSTSANILFVPLFSASLRLVVSENQCTSRIYQW